MRIWRFCSKEELEKFNIGEKIEDDNLVFFHSDVEMTNFSSGAKLHYSLAPEELSFLFPKQTLCCFETEAEVKKVRSSYKMESDSWEDIFDLEQLKADRYDNKTFRLVSAV